MRAVSLYLWLYWTIVPVCWCRNVMASSLSRCVADNDDIMFLSFRSKNISQWPQTSQYADNSWSYLTRCWPYYPASLEYLDLNSGVGKNMTAHLSRHYTLYISFLNFRFDGLGSVQACTHTIKHQFIECKCIHAANCVSLDQRIHKFGSCK